ncbi:metalloregulator ArsR/SmtB family transcription factor [Actinoplanes sp. NPDC051475]|uniref:ArsR/SmtB family transcription factor n=1 Tax=Actinoplanes sp. NPDC051475 TaxID=3157225 RepID=UPI00344B22CB
MVDLAAVLGALADPSRRVLLQRLAHGPATSGQLAELLSVSRPATSQHLQVLQATGLVRATALGRHRWYELAPGPLYLVEQWVRGLADTWAAAPSLDDRAGAPQRTAARREENKP